MNIKSSNEKSNHHHSIINFPPSSCVYQNYRTKNYGTKHCENAKDKGRKASTTEGGISIRQQW